MKEPEKNSRPLCEILHVLGDAWVVGPYLCCEVTFSSAVSQI